MAPPVSYAKTTLPFPIFAAEFDPYSRGYLVVGGGGGEGRSGVPNQIVSITMLFQLSTRTASKYSSRSSLMFPIAPPSPTLPRSTSHATRTLCSHSPVLLPRMA